MRIGIVGYGAVARLHADALIARPDVEVSVWGPDPARTAAFAADPTGPCQPEVSFDELIATSDGVIVASPTTRHEAQATRVLERGRAVLVELPACASAAGGERLADLSRRHGGVLRGVHATRALAPMVDAGQIVRSGRLGRLTEIAYERTVVLGPRSWTDDALRHHAQHPVDLFLAWFGAVRVVRCEVERVEGAVVRVEAVLDVAGVLASVGVRYASGGALSSLIVRGEAGVLDTDGFGRLDGPDGGPTRRWDPVAVYADSIRRVDDDFLDAISGGPGGTPWSDTIRLARVIDQMEAAAS